MVTLEHLEEFVRKEVTKLKILFVRNDLTKSLESLLVRSKRQTIATFLI